MVLQFSSYGALAIGAALVAAGWFGWQAQSPATPKNQRTAVIEAGTIEDVVTAQGKLEPKYYVDVGLQVSGQIKKLHVDIGDTVKKGDLLVEIDPRIYKSRIDADTALLHSLQAQVAEQQAVLRLAQQVQRRNKLMIQSQAISADVFDQGQAALDQAIAKLKSLQAQVEQTQSTLTADRTNLEYTKIYAPMNGTITSLAVREGNTLNSVQSAPTLMQIANLDTMTNRAQVAEADITRLKADTPVYFTTLGDLERKFTSVVRLVQPSPEILNNVVLFNVLIDVDNKEHALMDGMNTEVFFVLGKAEHVPVLPIEALGKRLQSKDDASGKAYTVRVLGQKDPVLIHVGLADRAHIEVRSGLKVGDEVVIPSHDKPANRSSKAAKL